MEFVYELMNFMVHFVGEMTCREAIVAAKWMVVDVYASSEWDCRCCCSTVGTGRP